MRCPKCHYISFGSVDRCRNCGYELALAVEPKPKPADLPIHGDDEPTGPLADFVLSERPAPASNPPAPPEDSAASGRRAAAVARLDLPLFSDRGDDAPLVTPPAVPRQPLSVRRGPPAIVRPRPERGSDADSDPISGAHGVGDNRAVGAVAVFRSESELAAPVDRTVVPAGVLSRLLAGGVDVLTLGAIDVVVLYSTLRLLEMPFTLAALRVLPPVPMIVFLLLLNGGYLAAFTTAGGQTIGKMLLGIRVVADRHDDSDYDEPMRVTLSAAVLRATAYIVSLLPAGLGFLPILFDAGGRALHDRLADTRVINSRPIRPA
jgi:uncharacterized RDD family membrane protein YckC